MSEISVVAVTFCQRAFLHTACTHAMIKMFADKISKEDDMKFQETQLSKRDRAFLDRAVSLSRLSDYKKFHHGAIVVKNGNVIAVGVNAIVNDFKVLSEQDSLTRTSVHAEVAALNACRKADLRGAVVYVARTNDKGKVRMSRPCPRCQKALTERGVKRVVFTVSNEMHL